MTATFIKLFSDLYRTDMVRSVRSHFQKGHDFDKAPALVLVFHSHEPIPFYTYPGTEPFEVHTDVFVLGLHFRHLPCGTLSAQGLLGTLWFQLNIDLDPVTNTLSQDEAIQNNGL